MLPGQLKPLPTPRRSDETVKRKATTPTDYELTSKGSLDFIKETNDSQDNKEKASQERAQRAVIRDQEKRDKEIMKAVNVKVKDMLSGNDSVDSKSVKGRGEKKSTTAQTKKMNQPSQIRFKKTPALNPVKGHKDWECNFCYYSGKEPNPLDDDKWLQCKCGQKYHLTCGTSLKRCFCAEPLI